MPDRDRKVGGRSPATVVIAMVAIASHLVPLGFWLHSVIPMMPGSARSAFFGLFLLARVFGLLGFVLMFWQYVLSSRIPFLETVLKRPVMLKQHRVLGKIGFLLILSHGVILLSLDPFLFLAKTLGLFALVILTIAVVAAWFCKPLKLNFKTWSRMHLAAYLVLPLVFIHALNLGSTVIGYRPVYFLFVVLFALYVLIATHRVFRLAGEK